MFQVPLAQPHKKILAYIPFPQDWKRLKLSGGDNICYPSTKLVVYCADIIYSLFLHNNHLITFDTQLKINTENPFPDYLDVISRCDSLCSFT